MLELYHHGSSVCAAKVRMVLSEKDMEWTGHYIDILKGEQFTPEYLALNPKGVVPVLIDDGTIIRESTVICEYIDHIHPDTPLRPANALEAARMRNWTKFVDEYVHPMCATLTFTCSHRVTMNRLPAGNRFMVTRCEQVKVRVAHIGCTYSSTNFVQLRILAASRALAGRNGVSGWIWSIYSQMTVDSRMIVPSSIRTGTTPLGLSAKYSGVNCSPFRISI